MGTWMLDWTIGMLASREMAMTHIDQDLRKALENNGAGKQGDWECVGKQISDCEKEYFNRMERLGSWVLGVINDTWDAGDLRDAMRGEVMDNLQELGINYADDDPLE